MYFIRSTFLGPVSSHWVYKNRVQFIYMEAELNHFDFLQVSENNMKENKSNNSGSTRKISNGIYTESGLQFITIKIKIAFTMAVDYNFESCKCVELILQNKINVLSLSM